MAAPRCLSGVVWACLTLCASVAVCGSVVAAAAAVDPTTIENKVLIGYQGWFGTDPEADVPTYGWKHWSLNASVPPAVNNSQFDMFPDLSEYPPEAMHDTDLVWKNGSKVKVYSNVVAGVVDVHFRWLSEYGLDGVFPQRFVNGLSEGSPSLEHNNEVLSHINRSACANGKVFALMYDVSGAPLDSWESLVMTDWANYGRAYTTSPCYLHEKGKPVLTIYGLGLNNHPPMPTAHDAIAFIHTLQKEVYLIGSGPYFWRSGTRDSLPNYSGVYAAFDALMPWSVGRYNSQESFAGYFKQQTVPDSNLTSSRGQGYAPIAYPGYSFHNSNPDKPFNGIPRLGGAFFQDQVDAYLSLSGATFFYIAMFDEINEGTAIYKTAATLEDLPADHAFLYNGIDGTPTPGDHFLVLAGNYTARAAARPRL